MRRLFLPFCLAALFFLLIGCASKQKESWFLPKAQPTLIKKQTQVEVFVSSQDIPQGKEPETILWEEAVKKGIYQITNSILQEKPLVCCTEQDIGKKESYVQRQGSFQAVKDQVTNDYSQKFKVSAELIPSKQYAGKISFIEDKRNYAGQSDFVTVTFFEPQHKAEGYFLVGKRAPQTAEENYLQLIGSGHLFRTLQDTGQAELLETFHDVRLDDFVLMLKVKVMPLKTEKELPTDTPMDEKEEVVVEPKWEPEAVSEPKESK